MLLNISTSHHLPKQAFSTRLQFQGGSSEEKASKVLHKYDEFYKKHPPETWARQAHVMRVLKSGFPGSQYLHRALGIIYGLWDKNIAEQNRIGFKLVREGHRKELTVMRKAAIRQAFSNGYYANGQSRPAKSK